MDTPTQSQVFRLLVLAVALGVLAGVAGAILLWVVDRGQEWFFADLPELMGMDTAPWWFAAVLLSVGATIVAIAKRLPGATGSGPLTGFHIDDHSSWFRQFFSPQSQRWCLDLCLVQKPR